MMTRIIYGVILIAISMMYFLGVFECRLYAQVPTSTSSPSPSPSACTPIPPPPCKNGESPGVIQLTPDTSDPNNKLKLARKHLYLSSCPFDLANNVRLGTAPSIGSYYSSVGASSQLIGWLKENHCETIFCRELTANEVECGGIDTKKCVPEFTSAYRDALKRLDGNKELARKWVTNYPPLSSSLLSVGFYAAKTEWLKRAVKAIETGLGNTGRIRSTITDRDGVAFFHDLCPGTYYISSIAPIEVEDAAFLWETNKPIKVEGPPEVNRAIVVTLAFPPGKDKKNFFVGKPVVEVVSGEKTSAP